MSHPRDDEAAEYAIGTLDPAERRAFERAMAADPELAGAVRAWEDRLAPLAERIEPVAPPAALWDQIVGRVRALQAANVTDFPSAKRSMARLSRSRAIWRGVAAATGSLAAALALFIAGERAFPPAPGPTLLAVVNRSGDLPALVVRVDPRGGIVQVRALAAETPAEHDLELWSIVGSQAPHSLGVIAPGATRIALGRDQAARLEGATLAVTVEQKGGSPTGAPTSQPVYSGRLIAETP